MKPKIALAADHAGYKIKEAVKEYLKKAGYEYEDFGTYSEESVDYPDFVHPATAAIVEKRADRGIFVCGSGQGTQLVANKYPGIRATLVWNREIAELARKHNDANVLSLPGRFLTPEEAVKIAEIWLETEFDFVLFSGAFSGN